MASTELRMRTVANVEPRLRESLPDCVLPEFLRQTAWRDASIEPLAGDASTRKYFRLRNHSGTAVMMDARRNLESIPPFLQIADHLVRLRFSAPIILAQDPVRGFLLLEDFGDATFAALLKSGSPAAPFFELGTDVLIALHRESSPVPPGLRHYDAERMLLDLELFLEWCAPKLSQDAQAEFRAAWRSVLPMAHAVPSTLLLRDYHIGNLMLLARRKGIRRAGLLDFQDAYQGPVTYDLMSLLEDARHEVPDALRQAMIERYLAGIPAMDLEAFGTSLAVVAAQRHTRVLAIFERLHANGRPEYRELHSPRVERMLHRALKHPRLRPVRRWMERHAA